MRAVAITIESTVTFDRSCFGFFLKSLATFMRFREDLYNAS